MSRITRTYAITSRFQERSQGVFEGRSPAEALVARHHMIGYRSAFVTAAGGVGFGAAHEREVCGDMSDWIIIEVGAGERARRLAIYRHLSGEQPTVRGAEHKEAVRLVLLDARAEGYASAEVESVLAAVERWLAGDEIDAQAAAVLDGDDSAAAHHARCAVAAIEDTMAAAVVLEQRWREVREIL